MNKDKDEVQWVISEKVIKAHTDQQEEWDRKRGSEMSAFPPRQLESKNRVPVVCSQVLYTDLPALHTQPQGTAVSLP